MRALLIGIILATLIGCDRKKSSDKHPDPVDANGTRIDDTPTDDSDVPPEENDDGDLDEEGTDEETIVFSDLPSDGKVELESCTLTNNASAVSIEDEKMVKLSEEGDTIGCHLNLSGTSSYYRIVLSYDLDMTDSAVNLVTDTGGSASIDLCDSKTIVSKVISVDDSSKETISIYWEAVAGKDPVNLNYMVLESLESQEDDDLCPSSSVPTETVMGAKIQAEDSIESANKNVHVTDIQKDSDSWTVLDFGSSASGNVTGETQAAWEIPSLDAGDYVIHWNYANGKSDARSMQMKMDDDSRSIEFPSTTDWYTWASYPVFFSLTEKSTPKEVSLSNETGDGPNLDYLTVEKVYQAEAATLVYAVISSGRNLLTDQDIRYIEFTEGSDADGTAEWVIEVPKDGVYDLSWSYSYHSTENDSISATLSVDGNIITTLEFASQKESGHFDAANLAKLTKTSEKMRSNIELVAGSHLIKLTASDGFGPKIDYISIYPAE